MKHSNRKFLASWGIAMAITLTVFAFNNCSEPFQALSDGSSTAPPPLAQDTINSAQSLTAFSSTLHPVLRTNCASCHGVAQAPLFAVMDASQSMSSILTLNLIDRTTVANSRLVAKIMAGHNAIATTVATQIQTQISAWLAAVPAPPVTPPPVVPPVVDPPPPVAVVPGTSLDVFRQTVHPWVVQNCASCHTNQTPAFATGNVAASRMTILNAALVNAANVPQSRLVTKLRDGHVAFVASHADEIQALIRLWVDNSVGGIGDVQALTPTFRSISALILMPKCVGCHGPVRADENVRYDTYANTMRTVRAGLPNNSRLYTECRDNRMPVDAAYVPIPLPAAEVTAIRQWIEAGALNN
jgi:mono/diheme cytochrome c family protein